MAVPKKKRQQSQAIKKQEQTPKPISTIPFEMFRQSLTGYAENAFVRYLESLFDVGTTSQLIKRFFIGTSRYWRGATVFWQIDTKGRIRSGKIMLYEVATGRRVKEAQPDGSRQSKITWAHSILQKQGTIKDFNLRQCLFGEHQLTGESNGKSIAIVESEKTAIIASCYLPDLIWLACGSLTNLTAEKCQALTGRKIILFPDLRCFEKWRDRAKQLQTRIDCSITVSDLLERRANDEDKAKGLDLADYLIKYKFTADELPDEIYIPANVANTIEAITLCIERQRRKKAA